MWNLVGLLNDLDLGLANGELMKEESGEVGNGVVFPDMSLTGVSDFWLVEFMPF